MKIAVTGSSGRIGRYVLPEFSSAGHEVSELDILDAPMRVDLTDAGQVYGALAGCEAVVHMGAWPNPGHVPDTCTTRGQPKSSGVGSSRWSMIGSRSGTVQLMPSVDEA